jgi:lipoprotein-anchoring transpeptidase ErfK/SrfK
MQRPHARFSLLVASFAFALIAPHARAENPGAATGADPAKIKRETPLGTWSGGPDLPAWTESDDMPLPAWARSVVARGTPMSDPGVSREVAVYATPGQLEARRGTAEIGAIFPLLGAKRGLGCGGRWFLVGPLAWICSDVADLAPAEATSSRGSASPGFGVAEGGAPRELRYFFAGQDGAYAYASLEGAAEDTPIEELEPGWGVAVVEEKDAFGERWGRTRRGVWIAMRDLVGARPIAFHGEVVPPPDAPESAKALAFAWVGADRANVYGAPSEAKATGSRVRFQRVEWHEEAGKVGAQFIRISPEDAPHPEWMRARDLSRAPVTAPPDEIGGAATTERWIDVDLASQTLVAYEGEQPVFATLVSTGRGAPKSETATPPGVHRIWVKLLSTKMDNLEQEDAEHYYSIEDVPYVQFFDKGVALHGAFWHHNFGRTQSHGCVNLSPIDAKWLFQWTAPHVPAQWSAALPSPIEHGTVVRVH